MRCRTTKGSIVIKVYPEWAPIGAERFLDLVKDGFYTDIAMYRCVSKFLTQFGISDNKDLKHWHNENIKDDIDKKLGIKKHYVSFAGGGKNSRSTQIFIAFEDLEWLGVQSDGSQSWETPFGEVVEGFEVLNALYKGYGDIAPFNKKGPDQQKIHNLGNSYIRETFPKIDFVESCTIDEDSTATSRDIDLESISNAAEKSSTNEQISSTYTLGSSKLMRIRRNSGRLHDGEGLKEYTQYDSDTAVTAVCFLFCALLVLCLLNKAGQNLFLLPLSRKEV